VFNIERLSKRKVTMAGIARMQTVVLDTPDPKRLAEFYRDLLGWEITSDSDETWFNIADGDGGRLSFQQAPDHRAPNWPGAERPQQFHIDVDVDDVDRAEAEVLAIGATKHDIQPGGNWRVYLDPAGHPFCLCWD
jgi:catechol 2,3-dioxygenase-like lactoylglutathione lyase family enzyme